MQTISYYQSPLGNLLLSASESGLSGLWFEGQQYFAKSLEKQHQEKEIPLLTKVKSWLDSYFSGANPKVKIPLHFIGTEFQKQVWEILCSIPYGKTITYGEIAKILANKRGLVRLSAQAVGGAVGRNNLSIIVPCHRVVGAKGNLTGYAAGIDKKIKLLELEKIKRDSLFIPQKP